MMKKIRLNVSYGERNDIVRYRNFDVVDKVPEVGDYWADGVCEVVAVEPVRLDLSETKDYDAYVVRHINRGFDEEREHPFEDYVAVARE